MFTKLKSASPTPSEKVLPPTPIDSNPISDYFEIGKQVGSAGPELAWKIYDGTRRHDYRDASVFFFDKRWADRLYKGPKRREVIVEVLRKGVLHLERLSHPRLLQVIHSLEETTDTMAFATEPVLGSLANILGCLEDRLRQGIPSSLREYTFTEFEHTYGLLQISEALVYLHYSARVIHRSICPQSVIVNKKGVWKLSGFEFIEKCSDGDLMLPVSCAPYTTKLPKMSQPDLDFSAPETQSSSACSPQSDIFSFGLFILSLYNNGRSAVESNFSMGTYFKQLETLNQNMGEILDRMPSLLREPSQQMVEGAPRKRPTSQNLLTIRYFMDPGVHSLQYMDAIEGKDLGYRINFYQSLTEMLNLIPKKMWFQNLIPSLEKEVEDHGSDGLAALLEPVLMMASECTRDEYQSHLLPFLRNIFSMTKSIQATSVLIENLEIFIEKTARSDFQTDVLPMVLSAFETNAPILQSAALKTISKVMDDLDDETIKETVLPKAKNVFLRECDIEVQENVLACILRVLDHLDQSDVESDILPMLLKAQLSEPGIMMSTAKIYRHLLSMKMVNGQNVEVLATNVMPSFFPVIVNPSLQFEDFLFVSDLMQEMFDLVTKWQRLKLKQDEMPTVDTIPVQFKVAIEAPSPTCPFPGESPSDPGFQFSVQAPSRRQSVCSEYIASIMSANSPDSSPDSEGDAPSFLQVQALQQRRHSDNSLQIQKTLQSGSSITNLSSNNNISKTSPSNLSPQPMSRARSSSSLINTGNRRRHSSVNPHDISRFATKLMDSAAESMVESMEKASKATSGMHLGLDTIGLNPMPTSPRKGGGRRCSVVDMITQPSLITSSVAPKAKSPKPGKKIFSKLRSEIGTRRRKDSS